jgi:hypothetical protein
MSDSLRRVRQKSQEFVHLYKLWIKNAPKGKVYSGFRFVRVDGGFSAIPVYTRKINKERIGR